MMNIDTAALRSAPPDKLAAILHDKGYPVSAHLLRTLHRSGKLPGVWTGKKLLIPVQRAIEYFEYGEIVPQPESNPSIRRIEE